MRAWIVSAFAAATLIGFPAPPAAAKDMAGHGIGIVRPHGRDRDFDFDHFSRRHHEFRHRRFVVFIRPVPFGVFGGVDTFDAPEAVRVFPPVIAGFNAPPPIDLKPAADRPPCRETTPVGVVIERGGACSRGTH